MDRDAKGKILPEGDSGHASDEETQAFGSDHEVYEAYTAGLDMSPTEPDQVQVFDQSIPIDQLDIPIEDNNRRLLIQPFNSVTNALNADFRVFLRQQTVGVDTNANRRLGARCLVIYQNDTHAFYDLIYPPHCRVFYATHRDSVDIHNRSPKLLIFHQSLGGADGPKHVIDPGQTATITPGSWRVTLGRVDITHFQIRIFPRQFHLNLVISNEQEMSIGRKRDHDGRANPVIALDTSSAVVPLDSIASIDQSSRIEIIIPGEPKQTLQTLTRLSRKKATQQVFMAKHSSFPEKTIVVKVYKPGNWEQALHWARELDIHRDLDSVVIARLLGFDARVLALYIEKIEGNDLTRRAWCDRITGRFRGTRQDTVRILYDISKSLLDLGDRIHNDIKPANILYSREKGACLIDLGLGSRRGQRPTSGGTPWYVGPEYSTLGERGPKADVWAFGVVVLWLIGCISLPDFGRDVKAWSIWEVAPDRPNPSWDSVHKQRSWLLQLAEMVPSLAEDPDQLFCLVARMLEPRPERRISREELAKHAEELMNTQD